MRIVVTFLLIFILIGKLKADTPVCYRFRLEIILDNNDTLIGDHINYGMYIDLPDTGTFEEIMARLKHDIEDYNYNRKLKIYKDLQILPYPKCGDLNFFYSFEKDIIELDLAQIIDYKVIKKSGCHPDNDYFEFLGGCPPEVITELNKYEIMLLEEPPEIEFQLSDYSKNFGDFGIANILSYDSISKAEIISIIDNFIINNNLIEPYNTYMSEEQYLGLKEILREQDIILFRTYWYN